MILSVSISTHAQSQCGIVEAVDFPVDPGVFRVMQDFGAPSPRHQGRFHTGEDWYGGRDTSAGTPVRAIAAGRVTFSSPNGWGRDGGVIIIEHRMPDDTIAYSQYGHIAEADGITFPGRSTCVEMGDVIAAVGEARPAPHLHLEIRTESPDTPGAGYTWELPTTLGYRNPSKFILNWQTWLSDAVAWHVDLIDEAAPTAGLVVLSDLSLIVLDADRVLGISDDGRVLWRINLDAPAVSAVEVDGYNGAIIVFADGTLRRLSADGTWSESRSLVSGSGNLSVTIDGVIPYTREYANERLLLHTSDNALLSVEMTTGVVQSRTDDIPPILRYAFADRSFSLLTVENEIITFQYDGAIVDRAVLREPAALFAGDGVYAYTQGGFWEISMMGEWRLITPDVPPGGESAAIWYPNGREFALFDGQTLTAYNAEANVLWAVDLPGWSGEVNLRQTSETLYFSLASTHGHMAVVRASDGAVCNTARIYGDERSGYATHGGGDGTQRVWVADQILGLDWQRFLLGCA